MPDRPQAAVFPQRFFFAILPPPAVARALHEFSRTLSDRTPRRPEMLHITLALSEDFQAWPGDYVERLLIVGSRVAQAPFRITLARVAANRNIVLLPGKGQADLKALHAQLAEHMRAAHAPMRDKYRFSPHLTLFYREPASPFALPVEGFAWEAEELVLIRSHVGASLYEVLARWALREGEVRQGSLF